MNKNSNRIYQLFRSIEKEYEYFLKHGGIIGKFQEYFMTGLGYTLDTKDHWMWGLKISEFKDDGESWL